ncbi:MAG: aminoacetone oxidase family FAD-binding enzyme, partial [Planctomycetota bacterium]
LLARQGVEGQVEHGFRLFTKSGRGSDVARALARELEAAGGLLVCEARISAVKRAPAGFVLEGQFEGHEEQRQARMVVICTGGLSYPATGSTGDGYAWARVLGHTLTPLRAALVGLATNEEWPRELPGLAWPDAEVALRAPAEKRRQGAALQKERGEILFTHFGISGPAILDLSNVFVASGLALAQLDVDFFPEVPAEELDRQLLARLKQFPNRMLANALEGFRQVPARLLERWQKALGPPGSVPLRHFSKGARFKLRGLMKLTTLTITGTRGVEHGEVTAGGVAWEEIDPATLESRLCAGLYFAGEMLDVAGRCGGFNLQAAFSTGFLAGRSAGRRAK